MGQKGGIMSVVYCEKCDRQVDIDQEDEHFDEDMQCQEKRGPGQPKLPPTWK